MREDVDNVLVEKSEEFAIRIVNLYKYLTFQSKKKEYILSKQLLRSGTSIGANISEAKYAISKDDFIAKLFISLKECNETKYWLNLLHRCNYLSQYEFDSIYPDCLALLKLLTAIINSLRQKKSTKS